MLAPEGFYYTIVHVYFSGAFPSATYLKHEGDYRALGQLARPQELARIRNAVPL